MDSSLRYPLPADELQRLRELERYGVIGSPSDEHFERIVELASLIFSVPITAISLVEKDRQWFLCNLGLEARETPRDLARLLNQPDAGDDPTAVDLRVRRFSVRNKIKHSPRLA